MVDWEVMSEFLRFDQRHDQIHQQRDGDYRAEYIKRVH
ncbi:hypothetical protein CPter291_3735 [Collimonas pratensis]|uniref:Uncharacterized protein n=1 Tax=Collimonas pratensis TaxID=279113 RepID=A0ABN4MFH0_9BURK|nr:hypothetical protein CPter291_3735 [Collimonas pratensis]